MYLGGYACDLRPSRYETKSAVCQSHPDETYDIDELDARTDTCPNTSPKMNAAASPTSSASSLAIRPTRSGSQTCLPPHPHPSPPLAPAVARPAGARSTSWATRTRPSAGGITRGRSGSRPSDGPPARPTPPGPGPLRLRLRPRRPHAGRRLGQPGRFEKPARGGLAPSPAVPCAHCC